MPRTARRKSTTGIYHIILRGINRQAIFSDEEDNEEFLKIMADCKKLSGYKLFGYCLMGNHVHLLIKEEREELGQIIKRIGSRYVYWYNWKYKRSGHLFQDRFKSEVVESDAYFLTALRYIYQNPLKAGLSKTLEAYKWSSYKDYIGNPCITDVDFALDMAGKEALIKYMNETNDDKSLELEEERIRLTDNELTEKIAKIFKIRPMMIQKEPKEKRDAMLTEILKKEGISARQLSRVTGISANIIWKLQSK